MVSIRSRLTRIAIEAGLIETEEQFTYKNIADAMTGERLIMHFGKIGCTHCDGMQVDQYVTGTATGDYRTNVDGTVERKFIDFDPPLMHGKTEGWLAVEITD